MRGLSWFGSVALVGGVVLLGSGIATAAQPGQKAGAVTASKTKKTTTTIATTTTTTLPSTTTTTAPCSPAPATVTSGGATVTIDPGSCIVNGTTVTVTGSGFTGSQAGAMLQCNTDNSQPTVMFLANAIPISCTNPLSKLVSTSATGSFSTTYTIHTGTVGPPCLSSGCTGTAATDSSGGNTITDAAKYPCGPPPGFTNGNCGIVYGDNDSKDPGITVPFTYNTNTTAPPPPNPAPTPQTQTSPKSATTTPTAKPGTTAASTGKLAFTGSGPGLWWLALVGVVLMVLGVFALAFVDQPRRLVRLALDRRSRTKQGP